MTVSVGVATWDGESLSDLVDRADRALYAAKAAGRNRVVVDERSAHAA
jgi:diguanylate cyclase (GGDEF)-like protein